jgi:hypothetical protein
MHRADIVRATGAGHVLTAEHDGVLVADVVARNGLNGTASRTRCA